MDAPPAPPDVEKTLVSVAHGNLGFASHAVAVGHYANDAMSSAEIYLSGCLGDQMRQQYRLGIYPGACDTTAVFLAGREPARPAGAVVVGLGAIGQLTPATLTRAFAHAVLSYAFAPRQPGPTGDDGWRRRLSTLLIGTGRGLLTVDEAVLALLRGVHRANLALSQGGNADRTIRHLEFVEVWADLAIHAARAVQQAVRDADLAGAFELAGGEVREERGGLFRVTFNEPPGWWQRLQIRAQGSGALEFTTLTDRARTEVMLLPTQRLLVDQFVGSAIGTTARDVSIGRVLFELLLPNAVKEQLDTRRQDMVLVLNDAAARYPWELLDDRTDGTSRPLAVDVGVVRQLETAVFRRGVQAVSRETALLIADPTSSMTSLESAQKEANQVHVALLDGGYAVTRRVRCDAREVLEALFAGEYRILHLTGHGVLGKAVGASGETVTGMVIGDDFFLAARDVEQMRQVPEVVFINCCHLGQVTGESADAPVRFNELAANVGAQFVRMGVRAVVAAGWAVDDEAGRTFAVTFYRRMLAGESFGQAVLAARRRTYDAHPGVNTWGAYQCYGDPGYSLRQARAEDAMDDVERPFVAHSELLASLDNLSQTAATATPPQVAGLRDRLARLAIGIPDRWARRSTVQAALGRAYAELELFPEAIAHFEMLQASADTAFALRDLEQLADCQGLWGMELWRAAAGRPHASCAEPTRPLELVEQSIELLDRLARLGGGPSRLVLQGAAQRRKACLTTGPAQRGALERMCELFRQAADTAEGAIGACAVLQWTAAEIAVGLCSGAPAAPAPSLLRRLSSVEAMAVAGRDARVGPDAVGAERLLLEGMAAGDLPDRVSEIVERYRAVRFRTGSPREFRLALEHVEFLIAVAESGAGDPGAGAALVNALRDVLAALTFWLPRPLLPAAAAV